MIFHQVLNAPKRRLDNEITRLSDSVQQLLMHCKIVDDIVARYNRSRISGHLSAAAVALLATGLTAGEYYLNVPIEFVLGTGNAGLAISAWMYWYMTRNIRVEGNRLLKEESLNDTFRRLYARQLTEGDEFVIFLWSQVKHHLQLGVTGTEISHMSRVKAADFKILNHIIEVDVPNLRRQTAPEMHSTR